MRKRDNERRANQCESETIRERESARVRHDRVRHESVRHERARHERVRHESVRHERARHKRETMDNERKQVNETK